MERQKLSLCYIFEVEEDSPAAGVANQVRSQSPIQALERFVVREKGPEDANAVSRSLRFIAIDCGACQLLDGTWEADQVILCRRVLTTSRGCTASVETVPAERPAMVSTSAGESRAWLSVIREYLVVVSFTFWSVKCKRFLELPA